MTKTRWRRCSYRSRPDVWKSFTRWSTLALRASRLLERALRSVPRFSAQTNRASPSPIATSHPHEIFYTKPPWLFFNNYKFEHILQIYHELQIVDFRTGLSWIQSWQSSIKSNYLGSHFLQNRIFSSTLTFSMWSCVFELLIVFLFFWCHRAISDVACMLDVDCAICKLLNYVWKRICPDEII